QIIWNHVGSHWRMKKIFCSSFVFHQTYTIIASVNLFKTNKNMSVKSKNLKLVWLGIVAILLLQITTFSIDFLKSEKEIVYIDNGKLLQEYQGMKDAQKVFQSKAESWKANIDTLASEVTRAIRDFEKESQTMSKKERQLAQELMKSKQLQLQNYQKAIQQQSAQEDAAATEKVLTSVNTFLKEYGEHKNYKIIMGANSSGNIIYAQEGLDITDEVIDALNKNYSGE
ncbi:MAG: OmpH family outer membrane protein, partial [Bacteroidota bacterium]